MILFILNAEGEELNAINWGGTPEQLLIFTTELDAKGYSVLIDG